MWTLIQLQSMRKPYYERMPYHRLQPQQYYEPEVQPQSYLYEPELEYEDYYSYKYLSEHCVVWGLDLYAPDDGFIHTKPTLFHCIAPYSHSALPPLAQVCYVTEGVDEFTPRMELQDGYWLP
jgi:hypothetical protein